MRCRCVPPIAFNIPRGLVARQPSGKLTPQTGKKGETYYTFALEVPANYPVPSSEIAKTQLIKGGYNLAAMLQAIWP